jgi:hypothetical protein
MIFGHLVYHLQRFPNHHFDSCMWTIGDHTGCCEVLTQIPPRTDCMVTSPIPWTGPACSTLRKDERRVRRLLRGALPAVLDDVGGFEQSVDASGGGTGD